MSLLNLPNELLLYITGLLRHQGHVYAMVRCCRRLYYLLWKYLLQHNIRYSGGSALIWAARMDRRNLVWRLLQLGAEVDTRGKPGKPLYAGTLLHAAVVAGHLVMVELLLKNGGNLEVFGAKGYKPLFLALLARDEDIAIFLFNKLSNPNSPIAGNASFTSLHAACLLQLPKSARVFLKSGAHVHARTWESSTPLHLALKPNDAIRSCTLELVLLLLKYGSNRDAKADSLGLQHPDPRVRVLFQNFMSLSPRFINIGRRWSVEVSSKNDYAFALMLASLDRRWVKQPAHTSRREGFHTTITQNMLDDKVSPVLDPSQLLQEQQMTSARDPLKVKKIRETLTVVNSTKAEISPTNLSVEPFPKLIGRKSPHPLESAAQLSWRDLRNSKTQLAVEEACTTSKCKIQELKSQAGQAPRKKRWQPLQLS